MTRELSTGAAATMMLIVVALFAAGFLAGAFYTQERQAGEWDRILLSWGLK